MIRMLTHFAIFGSLGLIMEIMFTGVVSAIGKNLKLHAQTSVWMFFIYGCAAFAEPLCDAVYFLPFVARGWIYAVCIFAVEFAAGRAMGAVNICPWDYAASKYNVLGVIRLDFAPLWFAAGLAMERVHFLLRAYGL